MVATHKKIVDRDKIAPTFGDILWSALILNVISSLMVFDKKVAFIQYDRTEKCFFHYVTWITFYIVEHLRRN